jgi:PAS domain S-box-containing protein
VTESEDGEAARQAIEAGRAVSLVRDRDAVETLAEAGLTVDRADGEDELRSRLRDDRPDCLVVDPGFLDSEPAAFLSTVRSIDPTCPVVWLTDAADDLADDAFDPATTVVERVEDPATRSFLVEKVRGVTEGGSLVGHGPDTYRMLVESARDGLYVLDANARVTYLNESFAAMLGYEREELLGSNAALTMAEGELERGQKLVQELIESDTRESEVIDMEMRTKGGDRITVSVHFVVLTDVTGTYEGLMGVVRDITDRKSRERELERYETIVQTTTEPIYVLDDDERFVRVNDAMTDEVGYDRESLLGAHVSLVTDESGVRRHETLIEDLVVGERDRATTEVELSTADGRRRQYALSLAVIREEDEYGGTVVTAHDVTELREHQRQLSVLDRVLRHNVRNKMSVVLGHATDIRDATNGEIAERAAAIEEAATELLELSDSARDFESVFADDARRTVAVDVVDAVEAVAEELRLEHPAATVRTDLPETAVARGHETFELSVNELLENAIVHSDGEAPTVDVAVDAGEEIVALRVADDGPGLNDTDRGALLRGAETPLEHTQGLGLWLVRWAVEVADGTIDIADNDPRGTVITVRLPTADPDG